MKLEKFDESIVHKEEVWVQTPEFTEMYKQALDSYCFSELQIEKITNFFADHPNLPKLHLKEQQTGC